jgi:plastocyanin
MKTFATKRNIALCGLLVAVLVLSVVVLQRSQAQPQAPTADGQAASSQPSSKSSSASQTTPSDTSTQPGDTNKTSPATNGPTSVPADNKSTAIIIGANGFEPASLTVKKGVVISWTNKDASAHAIDPAEGSEGPHSPQLKPGESYSYSFAKAGTYRYIDVMHPDRSGSVTVTD